MGEAIRIMLF